jgi:hypothetical protein
LKKKDYTTANAEQKKSQGVAVREPKNTSSKKENSNNRAFAHIQFECVFVSGMLLLPMHIKTTTITATTTTRGFGLAKGTHGRAWRNSLPPLLYPFPSRSCSLYPLAFGGIFCFFLNFSLLSFLFGFDAT